MFTDQQLGQFVLELPIITDWQPGHQVDRHKPFDQLCGGCQGEDFGKLGNKLCLIKGEEAYVTLAFGQFTNEIGLAVNLDLQVVLIHVTRGNHFFSELDVGRLAEDGLENQVPFTVSRLSKPKTDIDSQNFHSFLLDF